MYDALIIGGGHNGLVCAAYLAIKGKKVIVLEQREILGGACVTENFKGCKISRASYVYSLFHPKIVKDLELKKHGLEILERDPPSFTPFKDGSYLLLYQDIKKTQQEIAKFSKKDAENYPLYEATLDRIAKFVNDILLTTPPNPYKIKHLPTLLSLGIKSLALKQDLYTLVELLSSSAYDFTSKYFESEQLLATLCTDGIIGTCGGPFTPETAYVLLHHVMGGVNGHRGRWGYVKGGMGGLTKALVNVGRKHGVEYRTNSVVSEIIVKNNRAVGVALKNGDVITAKIVVSNADPRNTFEKLINEEQLPNDFLKQVKNIDYSSATSKINIILNGELKFYCYDGFVPGTFHICENCEYIERAFDDSKYGRMSENLVLEGCIPTTIDDTIAPKGKHILNLLVQYTPYCLKAGWDNQKSVLLDKTIDKLAEYTNIKDVFDCADVLTPLDLEKEFSLTKGNLFHGAMSLKQLFSMRPVPGFADYKTPIKNLYLCGSGTHPGGGITGIPGHNAAREITKVFI